MTDHFHSGGEMVVRALRDHGVNRVFCVPGESFLPILDGLYGARDAIDVIACRHEHGAANMAEAHAKLTGRPGVCLVTRGPGACNASIGVHTAFQDSTPMVLIVGQVNSGHRGREAFQEVDFAAMFGPLAKHAEEVSSVEEIPAAMSRAFHLAGSGRPGPVVLAMPEDVLSSRASLPTVPPAAVDRMPPDPSAMGELRRLLSAAERPMMLVGGSGWTAEARADIVAFAAANRLAVCCSFRRHDIFDNADDHFVGEAALAPNLALIERIRSADLLLVVGSRLGEITSQGYTLIDAAGGPALVHVHVDPEELGRVFRPRLGICADVDGFAAAARAMAPVQIPSWQAWTAAARAEYLADSTPRPYPGPLDLGAVMAFLEDRLPGDAIVTVDAGNFAGWAQRFLRFRGGRRLLGATNGAMGYAVPAAVAAHLACPRGSVVACVGDGGFGMTGQELATARQYGVKPIVLVFNNGMYGTIRMHQERAYPDHVIGTALANPDFAALARAFGAHGERVERTDAFPAAFERALAADRPALIELLTDPEQISTRATIADIRGRPRRRR